MGALGGKHHNPFTPHCVVLGFLILEPQLRPGSTRPGKEEPPEGPRVFTACKLGHVPLGLQPAGAGRSRRRVHSGAEVP